MKNVEELVQEVKEDLDLQAQYQMADTELDELRISGRFTINVDKLLPHLSYIVNYLHNSDDEDVVWQLTLNSIARDFEISLKHFQMKL